MHHGTDVRAVLADLDVIAPDVLADQRGGRAAERKLEVAKAGDEEVVEQADASRRAEVEAIGRDVHRRQRNARHELDIHGLRHRYAAAGEGAGELADVDEDRLLADDRLTGLVGIAPSLVTGEDTSAGCDLVVVRETELRIGRREEVDLVRPAPVAHLDTAEPRVDLERPDVVAAVGQRTLTADVDVVVGGQQRTADTGDLLRRDLHAVRVTESEAGQPDAGVRSIRVDRHTELDGHRGAAAGQRPVHSHAIGLLQWCAGRKILLAAIVAHREREERFAGVGKLDVVARDITQSLAVDGAAVRCRPLLEYQPLLSLLLLSLLVLSLLVLSLLLEEDDRVVLVIGFRWEVGDQRHAGTGNGIDLMQAAARETGTGPCAFGTAAEVVDVQLVVVPGHPGDVRAEIAELGMRAGIEAGVGRPAADQPQLIAFTVADADLIDARLVFRRDHGADRGVRVRHSGDRVVEARGRCGDVHAAAGDVSIPKGNDRDVTRDQVRRHGRLGVRTAWIEAATVAYDVGRVVVRKLKGDVRRIRLRRIDAHARQRGLGRAQPSGVEPRQVAGRALEAVLIFVFDEIEQRGTTCDAANERENADYRGEPSRHHASHSHHHGTPPWRDNSCTPSVNR